MPHDKNGALIEVGDHVIMEFVVTSLSSGEDFCNASLESVEPMPGSDPSYKTTLGAVNTRQTSRVAKPSETV